MESDERLISEQLMKLRGLARRTANLKMEVVKGIIQGSEFNPKLAKHAPRMALHCFKSQFFASQYVSQNAHISFHLKTVYTLLDTPCCYC